MPGQLWPGFVRLLNRGDSVYWSIKTKFILLLSILMAVILSLQFYFTQRTQQDILNLLTQISNRINAATEISVIRQEVDVQRASLPGQKKDSLWMPWFNKKNTGVPAINDHYNIWNWSNQFPKNEKLQERALRLEDLLRQSNEIARMDKRIRRGPDEVFGLHDQELSLKHIDSLSARLREIVIELNPSRRAMADSLRRVVQTNRKVMRNREAPSFTFVVPDFSEPQTPRLLRFQYNTADLNHALESMRTRTLLITLLIFAVSIVGIMVITRRFLKPIDPLKQAFEQVVEGDLDVNVSATSKDEIGSLTTAFNQMVDELRKNQQKELLLRRQERLASLGQLAAGVAHEIKNPLNAINLTIDHLGDTLKDDQGAASRKYIETIQKEIRRLDNLVNNFLSYLRSEELDRRETDINLLLREVLDLYDREMTSRKIETDLQLCDPFKFSVDGERLKTAFGNVLLNAIQAMPGGGNLSVQSDLQNKRIRFVDSGAGIEEKDLEHIFDLFYTTKTKGTGLGLPTAYKIIKAHGGDMQISSRPGQGTTVEFIFDGRD